jgi:toxin ParE1/3/4
MARLRIRPEATREFHEAIAWYENDYPGRGLRFHEAVMDELRRVQEAPEAFPFWGRRRAVRIAVVPRFPYAVFFVVEADGPMVYAIAANKRRPGYWRNRLTKG